MSKKIISLLLAIMLTVSMVAVAAVSVSAEVDDENRYYPAEGTDTNRYYFYMPSDWYNDYAYTAGIYWWGGTDACPSWPGYNAQVGDVDGVYYADVPTDVATIIWNNGFDGGEDPTSEEYALAIQTMNIGSEFYDEGESDLYPEGTESFDNMIYVVDPNKIDVSDYSGKMMCGGEWYYYYGNGEYGVQPTREEAVAADALFNTEYQPPKQGTDTTEPTTEVVENTTAPAEDSDPTTEPTEATTAPVVSAPYLTVNATSNYFPDATAEYNAETNEVTVTYWMKSSKDLLDTQWYMSYDSNVLSVSKKNNPKAICPAIGTSAVLNLGLENKIKYNATSLYLFDFSAETPFAQIVFDVKDISANAPVNTTISLDVDVLRVSKVDENTFMTDEKEEVVLVNNGTVVTDAPATVDRRTTLTESTYVAPETTAPVPTTEAPTTEEPTTEAPTTEPAKNELALTVNATSNYFPETSADYNAETKEVTVKYWFKSAKDVLDTQWYMTYDPAILSVSKKNTPVTICPTMGTSAVMNLDREGAIYFNASNLYLYNFADGAVFAEVVFDVNDISKIAPVTTTVALNVEVLRVSEVADNSMTDSDKEEILVNNGRVEDATVAIDRKTYLTESTYVAPTTEAPTTEEPTTEAPTTTAPVETTEPTEATEPTEEPTTVPVETTEPTEEPTTVPVETTEPTEAPTTEPAEDTTTAPVEDETTEPTTEEATDATSATGETTATSGTSSNNNANNNGTVQTGDASLAVIILSLLVVATGVMLALRKREMF